MERKPPRPDKLAGALGLARRAGRIEIGTDAVRRAIKRNAARVIVVASDRSERTRQKVLVLAGGREIDVIEGPTQGELGESVGKGPVQVVAVTDAAIAAGLSAIAKDAKETM